MMIFLALIPAFSTPGYGVRVAAFQGSVASKLLTSGTAKQSYKFQGQWQKSSAGLESFTSFADRARVTYRSPGAAFFE
jgi:outer membrane biogenesis lipoprotein LolB